MKKTTAPCRCGDDECSRPGEDGPCWGQIDVADEYYDDDEYLIHACEGHYDMVAWDLPYRPKSKDSDAPS